MIIQEINPVTWADQYGFSQAVSISDYTHLIQLSGQCSTDDNGEPLHPNNMGLQMHTAMSNLAFILQNSGCRLFDVASIRVFTTDIDQTLAHWDLVINPFKRVDRKPSSTLVEVKRLYDERIMVEIEATAYR